MPRFFLFVIAILALFTLCNSIGDAYVRVEQTIEPSATLPDIKLRQVFITLREDVTNEEFVGTLLIFVGCTFLLCVALVYYTPLEAFKTDAIFSYLDPYIFLPSISHVQINSQFILMFSLSFILIFFVFCFLYNTTLRNFAFLSLLSLCSFYLNQLKFSMQGLFVSFISILCVIGGFNIIGLIPLSGSFTAQIVVNLNFTFAIIAGLILIGFNVQGTKFLLTFVPSNVPVAMIPFLFVIEVLSFLMRIFSMSIRLFSNMVAGHSLLHLLTEFVYFIMQLSVGKTFYVVCSFIPLFLLYFWLFFELFVAFLQAYVFILLLLLYLNDINKTH